jgi:NADPH:quinone reductase-like Zn-dependent oxidoreductase|tara:strand:+ start:417 stop:548 length:132 start_codon:yes stop_codon:yes gene_type:complete
LGGARDGVPAKEVVLEAHGLVPLSQGRSDAGASTLPCAALTAQ